MTLWGRKRGSYSFLQFIEKKSSNQKPSEASSIANIGSTHEGIRPVKVKKGVFLFSIQFIEKNPPVKLLQEQKTAPHPARFRLAKASTNIALYHNRNVVEDYLLAYGFTHGYTKWFFHGEGFSSKDLPHPTNDDDGSAMHDDIDGLLHDTFRNVEGDLNREGVRERPSEDAKRFFKLVEEGKQELYPGCENFSKLDFTIWLFLFKCIHALSNVKISLNWISLL
uniref:Uncharacterized protein LOC104217206 n=1 Tax=Nicotiana sylvestris TaxID=4096 RepID=A0A1U7VL49_NICSY|nr:PREDICTED: uncharacterized protein LOC104217206 [Nicotiana sylvestris]